ncbi:hypothetical protein RMCBS344292_10110 [Rhizopus microsporus]|nr:hypothetical protein RMCBS344292_10110 [Rhizopus microsporus]
MNYPIAGWLCKLNSLPFKRSRWVSRYFILLESELRCYKDEFTATPSHILDLHEILQITIYSQRPFTFKLETVDQDKPWIIACDSRHDMVKWMKAIEYKMTPVSPIRIDERSISPDVYRVPTLSLRCTNLTPQDQSKKVSLLKRRNKTLTPIITQPLYQSISSSASTTVSTIDTTYSTSPTSPKHSITPSPTGAVLCTCMSFKESSKPISKTPFKKSLSLISPLQKYLSEVSPTYLTYKKRFRL